MEFKAPTEHGADDGSSSPTNASIILNIPAYTLEKNGKKKVIYYFRAEIPKE